MFPEPFVSRAKAPPAKRSEKGYGDENACGRSTKKGKALGTRLTRDVDFYLMNFRYKVKC